MQLLKTAFLLRNDLRWSEDVYQSCIYKWIDGSENHQLKQKNYSELLTKLPRNIDFEKTPLGEFSVRHSSLTYNSFSNGGFDYLAFYFSYEHDNRKWEAQIALRRTKRHVECFVSLNCALEKGTSLPQIIRPKIIDYLLCFQESGDGNIEISPKAHIIENSDISKAVSILCGSTKNSLPIVYLSCSLGTHSLKPDDLAQKLFGVAHVYAEEDKNVYDRIKLDLRGKAFPKRGEIGILYPHRPIDIFNRYTDEEWKKDPKSLVQYIYIKILKENLSIEFPFSTTEFLKSEVKFKTEKATPSKTADARSEQTDVKVLSGLSKDIEALGRKIKGLIAEKNTGKKRIAALKNQLENSKVEKEKLKSDSDTFAALAESYDEELKRTKEELARNRKELCDRKSTIDSLNQKLQKKSETQRTILLAIPDEPEMFPNEFICHLVSFLKLSQRQIPISKNSSKSRSKFILEELLNANSKYQKIYEELSTKKERLLSAANEQNLNKHLDLLRDFGMQCKMKKNNHWKITFEKDPQERFMATEASTPSETKRGGKNQASEFCRSMLWQ